MSKTSIPMNKTKDISTYFSYLERKYEITDKQLAQVYNQPELEKPILTTKTIKEYTSGKPNHAITDNTLGSLVYIFVETLKAQGISRPPELSTNFLLSSKLHPFLEGLALENDPASLVIDTPCNATNLQTVPVTDPHTDTVKQESEIEHRMITCDPSHNNFFIVSLFGFGGAIVLFTLIFNLRNPKLHLKKLSFIGLICLSASVNLAMPKLKQSIVVNPRSRIFYSHPKIWSSISQSIVLVLMLIAKPLMYISLLGLLICFII